MRTSKPISLDISQRLLRISSTETKGNSLKRRFNNLAQNEWRRRRNLCKVFRSYNKMKRLKEKIRPIKVLLRKNKSNSREQLEADLKETTASWVQTSALQLTLILIRHKWWVSSARNAHSKGKASSVSPINSMSNATTAVNPSLNETTKNCTKVVLSATLTFAISTFLLAKRMAQSSSFLATGDQLARSLLYFLGTIRSRWTLLRTS